MSCTHLDSLTLRPPPVARSVYREDCTQCFDSIDDIDGLHVCLQCFNGGCAGHRHHAKLHNLAWNHPLVLNIRRKRKQITRDEPPPKISKLAITAETDADRYDVALQVRCLDCDKNLDMTDDRLVKVVDAIMSASTYSRKEEVKAWEQELTSCEHLRTLRQANPREIASQDLGHCSQCELKENLWLCLECGNLGCGRSQFGGVGGNSHALAHSRHVRHGVAVKLGSITPEGSADVYCYTCDEERIDKDLAGHLENWGIILADRQKTEKSLTEMQIEQNLRWEFSMTTDDGKELTPLFGPGLTGLKNLGNSCYLASILQCLFANPSFQDRYGVATEKLPGIHDPAEDLETQLCKIGDGLLSGRYSKADSDIIASQNSPEVRHQKGLEPSMLKHLIGRGHAEFSTMRQQDAFELLQHLIKLITRSKHPSPSADPTTSFRFAVEQRLQCRSCRRVRYTTTEQDSIFIDVPLEKLHDIDEGGAAASENKTAETYKSVTFKQCLDRFTSDEVVELTCNSCHSQNGFSKRVLFKTLPEVLIVNARKMTIVNWVPVKVDVPVIVDDTPFLLDSYLSPGQQPEEETFPEEISPVEAQAAATFVPHAESLAQLEAMGFGRVRCEKALYATGNTDANAAMEWLFQHMEDHDIDEPMSLGGVAPTASADPEKIELLGAMGFSASQAKKALQETTGDLERAVEWLFSHPEDLGLDSDADAGSREAAHQVPMGSSKAPATYQLQSIVCHKGTSIHAGHYVAFVRKKLPELDKGPSWVLFNDEKVVQVVDVEEMKKYAYVYFFGRVL